MNKSRRSFLCGAVSAAALGVPLFRPTEAWANSGFEYDALGRLTRATLADGTTVYYRYDAAGNRTQVDASGGPPPPTPFNATIQVTASPSNLRALADAAGYTGAQPATITFTVPAGVTVSGIAGAPNGGVAIDTGTWPTGAYSLSFTLAVAGNVYGGGGQGGKGAEYYYSRPGVAGGMGGDAVLCRTAIQIVVQSGGAICGGGGGGGGGGASNFETDIFHRYYGNGGGGGGGFPNGLGGAPGGSDAGSGNAGTVIGGGAGGAYRYGSPGGVGGGAGNAGMAGTNQRYPSGFPGGSGGVAGHAIRKNGNSVPVTNNGTISGAQG